MVLKEFNEKMEEIPGTLPNIVLRIKERWEILNNNKDVEGFGNASSAIIMFILFPNNCNFDVFFSFWSIGNCCDKDTECSYC